MNQAEIEALAVGMAPAIRDAIKQAVQPLIVRLAALEARKPEKGEPGNDGRDGFSLEDFDCQPVDERTIKLTFARGDLKHSYELQFPVPVYRGVFRDGEQYERGDTVTWGGSLWHCDNPTKDKPGTESWTLAAKKGRDGKDMTKGG